MHMSVHPHVVEQWCLVKLRGGCVLEVSFNRGSTAYDRVVITFAGLI